MRVTFSGKSRFLDILIIADLGVKVSYTCFSTSRFGVEEKFYLKERKILTKDAKSAIMHS